MIDSHCHLDIDPLYSQIEEILLRSKKNGLSKLLTICTTSKSFEKIIEIIALDEMIYGTFGIHPHESENDIVDKKTIINNVKNNDKIIGIGETGLDFYYNHSNKIKQIDSFKTHIEAALELNLPIIVHSRNAEEKTFEILNAYRNNNPKILMHCFTGTNMFCNKLLELNSYFSASGIITFKNSNDLQNTFKQIPTDKLLIETDSPYLAPTPFRGKKNEPSYIRHTAEKLAEIKNINFEDIKNITTRNFNLLFSL